MLHAICLLTLAAGTLLGQGTANAQGTTDQVMYSHDLHVHVADNLVSISAHNVILNDVLLEITQQCHLTFVIYGHLGDRVSFEFDSLPVPEALKTVLRGRSFALRYVQPLPEDNDREYAQSSTLWVFSDNPGDAQKTYMADRVMANNAKTGASGIAGNEPETSVTGSPAANSDTATNSASVDTLAVDLQTGNNAEREDAVDMLGDIGGTTALQLLEQALTDPEADVREAAIDSIAGIGGDEAAQALTVGLEDEEDSLREDTVDALGEIGGKVASRLLQQALNDEQPFIREAAAEHLARLSSQGN